MIDRGPYVKGRAWDLTAAASEALASKASGQVRYAVALSYARPATAARPRRPPSAARAANLPCIRQRISNERSMGMSRSSHGAFAAVTPRRAAGWRWRWRRAPSRS